MAMAVADASTMEMEMEVEHDLPGFRFHPTEEELLGFYLSRVALGKKLHFDIIGTLNIYRHDPWDLPGMAKIGEREWYFFVPRDRKAGSGGRPNRTTERGFWKATGSDRAIRSTGDSKRVIGLKKTLVFYHGRAPRGTRTDWVMNEYRLPDHAAGAAPPREDTVLCKIYRKATPLKELEQRASAMEEMMMQRPRCSNRGYGYGGEVGAFLVPAEAVSAGDDYMSSSDDVQDNFLLHSSSFSSAAPSDNSNNDDAPRETKNEADVAGTVTVAATLSSLPQAANPPCSFQLPAVNQPCSLQQPASSNGVFDLPSLQLPAASHGVFDWLQDPFLTQLSPYAHLLYY